MQRAERASTTLLLTLLVAAGALGPAAVASALSTTLWRVDTAEQLEQGELEQVTVSSLGEVRLGRSATRLPLKDVALVWSLVEDGDGTVYLGTGNDGVVLRLKGTEVEEVARLDALVVSALALGEGGALYAGTLPGGKVYRLEPAGKGPAKVRVFAELEKADHVWALAWDRDRRVLFAGTGPEGLVYAIDATGRPSVYLDATDEHVLALVLERPGGDLLAGTSPGARLLRVSGPGRGTALHDFDATEVKSIARSGEDLYLAVNSFPDPPAPAKAAPGAKAVKVVAPAARPKPGKGKVFRRRADGAVEPLASFDDGHLTAVEAPGDGLVYAAAGAKGRVLAVDDERVTYTVLDLDERQVLALGLGGKTPIVTTGDAGAVYRIGKAAAATAEYRTAPLDAEFLSEWGALEWRASGELVVQTRTGNTKTPDKTWSDWSEPLPRSGAKVGSPAARYLQVRARWSRDPAAVLRALSVFLQRRNQRPVVTEVEVESPFEVTRPGLKSAKTPTKRKRGAPGKAEARSTVLKVSWKVDNPDADELRYRLFFRREAETVWQAILPEDSVLGETSYEWNTESVPSGHYLVKVQASDEVDNPEGRALRHEKVTPPVVVDNDPPRFLLLEGRGRRIVGRAVDGFSPIARIEHSLDGRTWSPVLPADSLFDSTEESFAFDLPASIPPGPVTVAVRIADRADNQAVGRLALTLP